MAGKYHSEGIGKNKKIKALRNKPIVLIIDMTRCQVCGRAIPSGGYLVGGGHACAEHLEEIYDKII